MSTAVAKMDETPSAIMEKVVIGGDLSVLSSEERVRYYGAVCKSVGLNPLTKPFEYLQLKKKIGDQWKQVLILYATRDCTDQLRAVRSISLQIVGREVVGGIYVVTTRAKDRHGREDEATGAVAIAGLSGEQLANAYMKAETKSKRRVTLSISGLGMLDESELEAIGDPETAETEPGERRPAVAMPQSVSQQKQQSEAPQVDPAKKINEGQVHLLQRKLEGASVNADQFCEHFGVKAVPDLPFGKINEALKYLTEHTPE